MKYRIYGQFTDNTGDKSEQKSMDEEWHPLFCEALNNNDQTEYLLDILLNGDVRYRAFFNFDGYI